MGLWWGSWLWYASSLLAGESLTMGVLQQHFSKYLIQMPYTWRSLSTGCNNYAMHYISSSLLMQSIEACAAWLLQQLHGIGNQVTTWWVRNKEQWCSNDQENQTCNNTSNAQHGWSNYKMQCMRRVRDGCSIQQWGNVPHAQQPDTLVSTRLFCGPGTLVLNALLNAARNASH